MSAQSSFVSGPVPGRLNFPQFLTEAYKPGSIGAFVGLEKQKKILESGRKPSHVRLAVRRRTWNG